MPADRPARLVFVSLLRDPDEAAELTGFLEAARVAECAGSVSFATAPVRGLSFLADQRCQQQVDRWWSETMPADAHPVYLLMHEEGLDTWIPGLDGTFYIGVSEPAGELDYRGSPAVHVFAADGPIDFASAVMRDFSDGVFDEAAARRLDALTPEPPVAPSAPAAEPEAPHPFDLLMAAPPPPPAPPPVAPAPAPPRRSAHLVWPRRRAGSETSSRDLAAAAAARGSTVVVMGSRKGGVGKTSHAAGVAIVAGEVLDLFGHRAAIVDANIANPDAWGHLNLPAGAATVREVVASLTANREPPPPVHAASPALACYPETRQATEYSKTDISRLAVHLRSRHSLIVVDMSNRLPDPLAGPEAAAAAYWLEHSDVLVLPAASSKEDFNGVLDYLDVPGLPPTVVPYIVPGMRRNREHPLTRQYLEAIRHRVHTVVPMPDEADKVRYASMEGVPVQQVSPALRSAYRILLEAIVRVPPRVRA